MYTPLPSDQAADHNARAAADIIKSCVHCGFCLPACPTYQLLGDELDSPRGRIYLIKQMAEGHAPGEVTQQHLDRCLTCRSCESACPSGVKYGQLIDIGREMLESRVRRKSGSALQRALLGRILSNRRMFSTLLRAGRLVRPLLPSRLAAMVPDRRNVAGQWPQAHHARRMLVLTGCVQPALQPDIDAAAARVLDRIGISLIPVAGSGCCGALNHHLSRADAALEQVRRNIDTWIPALEAGAECIVITASGCGVMVKDYGHLLAGTAYADKAARVSAAARDLSEVLTAQDLLGAGIDAARAGLAATRIAWQSPCTLQHGQKIRGRVEALLRAAKFEVLEPTEATRCCGSAGTYSILQADLSARLRELKLKTLLADQPQVIATANIGCLEHLRKDSPVPVRHWVEIIADAIGANGR